uniref:Uncharacterized protein n=1 Tax=Anopheles atroparvus TaxID=41427 RepID=A0A182JAM6_ANOAO
MNLLTIENGTGNDSPTRYHVAILVHLAIFVAACAAFTIVLLDVLVVLLVVRSVRLPVAASIALVFVLGAVGARTVLSRSMPQSSQALPNFFVVEQIVAARLHVVGGAGKHDQRLVRVFHAREVHLHVELFLDLAQPLTAEPDEPTVDALIDPDLLLVDRAERVDHAENLVASRQSLLLVARDRDDAVLRIVLLGEGNLHTVVCTDLVNDHPTAADDLLMEGRVHLHLNLERAQLAILAVLLELLDALGDRDLRLGDGRLRARHLDDVELLVLRRHLDVHVVRVHQLLHVAPLLPDQRAVQIERHTDLLRLGDQRQQCLPRRLALLLVATDANQVRGTVHRFRHCRRGRSRFATVAIDFRLSDTGRGVALHRQGSASTVLGGRDGPLVDDGRHRYRCHVLAGTTLRELDVHTKLGGDALHLEASAAHHDAMVLGGNVALDRHQRLELADDLEDAQLGRLDAVLRAL